jgi:lipid-A-disaccharide synthase
MEQRAFKIFFSVGEPSGDLHAANLIRELRTRCPAIEAVGYGGPNMREAGCELHADLTELALMGFLLALVHLDKFWALASRADRYFRHNRPDAVVLVDYPGFNWWIAWRAKVHGIPVFYYTPPQIWAWATWRVKKMRRLADHVLCSLPFEEPWFRSHGCNATFVGHPFFDEVQRHPAHSDFMDNERSKTGPLVTILPGSRTQEVKSNLPTFLRAAMQVHRAVPTARFAVAAFKRQHAAMALEMVEQMKDEFGGWQVQVHSSSEASRSLKPQASSLKPTLDIYVGRTPELMQLATCCMACSGSVSLELLYYTKPTVILYEISRLMYEAQKRFRKVRYITLVNILSSGELYSSDREPYDPEQPDDHVVLFPEYVAWDDRSASIATHLVSWLTDEGRLSARIADLEALKRRVAHGGASARAAEYILHSKLAFTP